MVFIWFSHVVFTGFPGGLFFRRIRHGTLPEVGENRPMEGRNDLDIDPGCLALVLGFLGKIHEKVHFRKS